VHEHWGLRSFEWQVGYGAFSANAFNMMKLRNYIRNQKEHHKKVSFETEFAELMRMAGIDFDWAKQKD